MALSKLDAYKWWCSLSLRGRAAAATAATKEYAAFTYYFGVDAHGSLYDQCAHCNRAGYEHIRRIKFKCLFSPYSFQLKKELPP